MAKYVCLGRLRMADSWLPFLVIMALGAGKSLGQEPRASKVKPPASVPALLTEFLRRAGFALSDFDTIAPVKWGNGKMERGIMMTQGKSPMSIVMVEKGRINVADLYGRASHAGKPLSSAAAAKLAAIRVLGAFPKDAKVAVTWLKRGEMVGQATAFPVAHVEVKRPNGHRCTLIFEKSNGVLRKFGRNY